jgi:oligopeptide/dipeptide ABC transporter ATP-binding protein
VNSADPAPILQIRDLVTEIRSVRALIRPVDHVSITVGPGQTVGIVGESGSGKSMTAFSVMQLFPTRAARVIGGSILLRGRDLLELRSDELRKVRGRDIGMVFQDPAGYLNPVLSVGRQIEEQLSAHGRGGGSQDRVGELLRMVGLPDEVRLRYPHQLSGGQCQRVGIASALACEPALVIADEPTTALDVTIQAQVLRLLVRLQRENGVAMLLITHDLGVVAEVCDYVYVMYAGRIVEEGPIDGIFDSPKHPYTRGLLSGVISLHRPDRRARPIGGSVPDLADPPAGCRFHPRCPQVMDRCRSEQPPFFGTPAAACWLHEEGEGR